MSSAPTSGFRKLFARGATYNSPITVGDIKIQGDVNGNIIIGQGNRILQYVVNKVHGTVINYYTRPAVKLRDVKPQPPRLPADFVGREAELKHLELQIKAGKAVLLHGHEGIGKTTLIRKAANSSAAVAMQDGVLFLEGEEEQTQPAGFEDLLQKLFDALHESDPHMKVDRTTARTYLSNTKPLVVIDRLEIPAQALRTIPDYFPKGAVVITSRDYVPTDAFESMKLSPLSRNDAIRLLSTKSGLDRNTSASSALDEICALLTDIPLAITTIARAIRENRIALADVTNQLKRIQSPAPDPAQAAIEISYMLVYSLLKTEERHVLTASVVAAGISIDRDILESIVSKEAVNSVEKLGLLQANSPRLRLPDGLRPLIQPTSHSRLFYSEQFLDSLVTQLKTRDLDFDFISDELGNLLGLIGWAENEKRWSDIIKLGRAIDPYLTLHGLWDAWQTVIRQVLTAADQLSDKATRAWALHQLGTREAGYGNLKQAKNLLEEARDTRKSIGDTTGAAYTQHNLRVLFPPLADPTSPDRSFLPWIISGLVIAAIIAVLIALNNSWATYTNREYSFEFRYPRDGVLSTNTIPPVVANIALPAESNDIFEKELDAVASTSQTQYPCQVTINPKDWLVKPMTLNNIEFLHATQKVPTLQKTNYEVYATKQNESTWICLVFSYSPLDSTADRSNDPSAETGIFRRIASTFRWLAPPPFITEAPAFVSTTSIPSPTRTNTPIPTVTWTPTPTSTPTSTSTPTPSPTATNTPCVLNTAWPTYIIQPGDTLYQISLWYSDLDITPLDLQKANCKETTIIRPGERLHVPRTPPPASITGYIFSDPNNNRVQDPGEQRLPKVTVTLTNANGEVVATTITNADGVYQFTDLPYGLYQVFQYYIFVRPDQTIQRNFGVVPVP